MSGNIPNDDRSGTDRSPFIDRNHHQERCAGPDDATVVHNRSSSNRDPRSEQDMIPYFHIVTDHTPIPDRDKISDGYVRADNTTVRDNTPSPDVNILHVEGRMEETRNVTVIGIQEFSNMSVPCSSAIDIVKKIGVVQARQVRKEFLSSEDCVSHGGFPPESPGIIQKSRYGPGWSDPVYRIDKFNNIPIRCSVDIQLVQSSARNQSICSPIKYCFTYVTSLMILARYSPTTPRTIIFKPEKNRNSTIIEAHPGMVIKPKIFRTII